MTLTLELTPEQEARLVAAAQSKGIAATDYIGNLVEQCLPPLLPESERSRRQQVMRELVAETERLGLYR